MKIKELQLNGSNNYKQTENELGAEYYCLFLKELKLFSKLKICKVSSFLCFFVSWMEGQLDRTRMVPNEYK